MAHFEEDRRAVALRVDLVEEVLLPQEGLVAPEMPRMVMAHKARRLG